MPDLFGDHGQIRLSRGSWTVADSHSAIDLIIEHENSQVRWIEIGPHLGRLFLDSAVGYRLFQLESRLLSQAAKIFLQFLRHKKSRPHEKCSCVFFLQISSLPPVEEF